MAIDEPAAAGVCAFGCEFDDRIGALGDGLCSTVTVEVGYTATDLNGFRGTRTVAQGAAIAIQLATLPDGGPTGEFFDDAGTVPW